MTSVTSWELRPREEANLLNPVFMALLMTRAAVGHRETFGRGLPWPLIYLALPAVLHQETRDALPRNVRADMGGWARAHPLLTEGLAERARALRPLITEALLFGLAHGVIKRDDALLEPGRIRRRSPVLPWREPSEDFRACISGAAFMGRWCAVSGTPATIFALWGLRP
jgi:ABC-3C biological conflict system middle component